MKTFSAILVFFTLSVAQAETSQVKKNLERMFKLASAPVVATMVFEKERDKYLEANFPGYDKEDWLTDFCFEEKSPWNLVPFTRKKFDRMVNASHPACRKYRVDGHKNHQEALKRFPKDELIKDLPNLRRRLIDEDEDIFSERHLQLMLSQHRKLKQELLKISRDKNISPLELCTATSLLAVSSNYLKKVDDRMNDSSLYRSGNIDYIYGYSYSYLYKLQYMAAAGGDWWAKTNGRSDVCVDFWDKLSIEELRNRMDLIEERMASLATKVEGLSEALKKNEQADKTGVLGILSLGFMGYRLLF